MKRVWIVALSFFAWRLSYDHTQEDLNLTNNLSCQLFVWRGRETSSLLSGFRSAAAIRLCSSMNSKIDFLNLLMERGRRRICIRRHQSVLWRIEVVLNAAFVEQALAFDQLHPA